MQRTRLGQILVALGLALAVVGGLLLSLVTVLRSPSTASEAAPSLIPVDAFEVPIEAELARSVEVVLPPGAMAAETAALVAARMDRDSAVIDEISDAAADAHRMWMAGEQAVLVLDPAVVTPAAVAALRDVDLGLSRALDPNAEVQPAPIALPATTRSAERVETAGDLARWLLIGGAIAFIVGAVLDDRRDRTIARTATALIVFGLALAVGAIVARLVDVPTVGWSSPTIVAMVAASTVPLLLGAAAAIGLGAFCRAVANQLAPTVAARIEARERAAVTPPPASTGPQVSRRKGREVRQQAIDAFFESEAPAESEPADPEPAVAEPEEADAEPATEVGPVGRPSIAVTRAPSTDGFDRALDAVETSPSGTSADDGDDPADDEDSAAQERREVLEKVEPDNRPLRTHLPR